MPLPSQRRVPPLRPSAIRRLLLTLPLLLFGASHLAVADPATYTLAGTFSGTLGATSFSNLAGTFTFLGDTSTVQSLGGGFFLNTAGTSTLALAGLPLATFTSSTFGVESEFNAFSFYDTAFAFAAGLYNPALGSYALTVPLPSTSGSFVSRSASEPTSLGLLSLSGEQGLLTAQATVPTPEPTALLLLGSGALGAVRLIRRPRLNL